MEKASKNNLKEMSLKEIFEITNAIFYETDISNFCNDIKVINRFIFLRKKGNNYKEIIDFLIENEDKVDKEKLVFNIYLNYNGNIPQIEQTMEILCREIESSIKYDPELSKLYRKNLKITDLKELKRFIFKNQDMLTFALKNCSNKELVKSIVDKLDEVAMLESEYEKQKEYKRYTKGLLKDTDVYIDESDIEDNHLNLKIYSSKDEYEGKRGIDRKKRAKLDKIDRTIGYNRNGVLYVVQPLSLSDLKFIMPEKEIGMRLRENILCNSILKQGKYTYAELEKMKRKDYQGYEEILQKALREIYLDELRQEVINNSKYVDLDKLFLISIYRFEEYIEESKNYDPKYYQEYRNLAIYIMNLIENKDINIKGKMQKIVGGEEEVDFSYEDAEKFMQRLAEDEYIPKEKIEQTKCDLLQGKTGVKDIPIHILPALDITNEELDKIINLSSENAISIIEISGIDEENVMGILKGKDSIDEKLFSYVMCNKKISINSALELYSMGKISIDFFKNLSKEMDLSNEISIGKINEEYLDLKSQKNKNDKASEQLKARIEVFKLINLEGKKDEEKEEIYNNIIEQIAESFEDENDALYYYRNGLISIGIIADWLGEEAIEGLYNSSKINRDDLMMLSKQREDSRKTVEQLLLVDDISYDELISLIYADAISESKIVDLYMQGKIFDADFEEMLYKRKISHQEFFTATELRTQEKLEENAAIKLSPVLRNIPDKKDLLFIADSDKESEDDWFKPSNETSKKTLIHPEIRREYLRLLGAKEPEEVEIDEDNAFYHYEFFVIPNKDGTYDLNSVVIAERFYNDKFIGRESGYALDNATYFFQYKDLMVNSNLSKNEMTKERDKIVFRANHRSGSWAISVLQRIAQTMMSTKFPNCTSEKEKDERAEKILEQLDKILTPKQIKSVLDLAGKIDDEEEYTYDLIGETGGSKRKKETNDDNEENVL